MIDILDSDTDDSLAITKVKVGPQRAINPSSILDISKTALSFSTPGIPHCAGGGA